MSIQGKKIAMLKHACKVAQSVISNVTNNFNNPILLELGLVHIKAQGQVKMDQIQSTPAERFNDDGTLKPAPELQHGEWHVKMGGLLYRLEKEYIPREPKNFEANV